jgi:hypothetical protein
MIAQIQVRRGTTAEWAASPVVLAAGELGLDTTLKRIKIGDGSLDWEALPWLNEISVSSFGATGDGVTDDTAAVIAAIAAAPAGSTVVFEIKKTYLISDDITIGTALTLDLNGSTILCDGTVNADDAVIITSDGVTIKNGTIDLGYAVDNGIFASGYDNLTFSNLTITKCPLDADNGNKAIYISNGEYVYIDKCNFIDNWNSSAAEPFRAGGIMLNGCKYCWLTRLHFNHCGNGINMYDLQNAYVDDVDMYDINDNGFYIQNDTFNIVISNLNIVGVQEGVAIQVNANFPENGLLANIKVNNAHFENAVTNGLYIRRGSGVQVTNATFKDCTRACRMGGYRKWPTWDSGTTYNTGDKVTYDGDNKAYISLIDSNTTTPAEGTDWTVILQYYRVTDVVFDDITIVNDLASFYAELYIIYSDRIRLHNICMMGTHATDVDGYYGIYFSQVDDCIVSNARIIGPSSGTVLSNGIYLSSTAKYCTILNPKVTYNSGSKVDDNGTGNVVENWWP